MNKGLTLIELLIRTIYIVKRLIEKDHSIVTLLLGSEEKSLRQFGVDNVSETVIVSR